MPTLPEDCSNRPFRKFSTHDKIFGVCAGLAYGMGVPVLFVRLATVFLTIMSLSSGLLVYAVAALVMEDWDPEPSDYKDRTS